MARIVFGGVLERYPTLKVLIHHGGSMIPHFAGRVGPGWDQLGSRTPADQEADVEHYPLSRRPLDYFKMFYADPLEGIAERGRSRPYRDATKGPERAFPYRFPLPGVGENVYSDDYTRVVTIC